MAEEVLKKWRMTTEPQKCGLLDRGAYKRQDGQEPKDLNTERIQIMKRRWSWNLKRRDWFVAVTESLFVSRFRSLIPKKLPGSKPPQN